MMFNVVNRHILCCKVIIIVMIISRRGMSRYRLFLFSFLLVIFKYVVFSKDIQGKNIMTA